MTRLEVFSKMVPWQRRLEAIAMKVMLRNPGILIQVSPLVWGGGEQPYSWAIQIYITERGNICDCICFNEYCETRPEFLAEWFDMKFTEVMGRGYELPTHKSK